MNEKPKKFVYQNTGLPIQPTEEDYSIIPNCVFQLIFGEKYENFVEEMARQLINVRYCAEGREIPVYASISYNPDMGFDIYYNPEVRPYHDDMRTELEKDPMMLWMKHALAFDELEQEKKEE